MVICTITPGRAAVRLNSGVRRHKEIPLSTLFELAKKELDVAFDVQVLAEDRLAVAEEALAQELSRIRLSGTIGTDVAVLGMLQTKAAAVQVLHLATSLVEKRRADYKAATGG